MSAILTLTQAISAIGALGTAINKGIPITEVMESKQKRSVLITNGKITELVGNLILEPLITIENTLMGHKSVEDVVKAQIGMFQSIYIMGLRKLLIDKGLDLDTSLTILSSRKERGLQDVNDIIGESLNEPNEFLTIIRDGEAKGEKSDKEENAGVFTTVTNIAFDIKKDGKEQKFNFNIMVKARVNYVPLSSIKLQISATNKVDRSLWAGWHDMRSGAKTFRDFMLGTSMLKDDKARLLSDHEGLLKEKRDREEDANRMLATHGYVGFGKYYQMVILTTTGKAVIENEVKSSLNEEIGKQVYLDSINALSVTIMNERQDVATTYINGLPGRTAMSFKSLKRNKKDDTMDDILKIMAAKV